MKERPMILLVSDQANCTQEGVKGPDYFDPNAGDTVAASELLASRRGSIAGTSEEPQIDRFLRRRQLPPFATRLREEAYGGKDCVTDGR
jgi:hypothetical protein